MPLDASSAAAAVAFTALVVGSGAGLLVVAGVRLADRAAWWGIATGVGVAFQPLLWLWLDALHVPVRAPTLVVALGTLTVAAASRRRRRLSDNHAKDRPGDPLSDNRAKDSPGDPLSDNRANDSLGDRLPAIALGVIILASLAARWWSARAVDLPRWGDSVHHTIIVDLLENAAGLPETWLPYAPLGSFSYHFGFHAVAAGIAELTGLAPHAAVIAAGQLLMVAGIATAYGFGAILAGRSWVGIGAALAAAGLSTMPAYYLNWGRYTQLAGQVVLPAAVACLVLAARHWRSESRDWRAWFALAAIAIAGLALTHYIVVLFLALFVVAWVIVGDADPGPVRAGERAPLAAISLAAAGVGFLLALPWLPHFLAGPIGGYAISLSTSRPADPGVFGVNPPSEIWSQAGTLIGWPLIVAFAAGAILSLVRRDRAGLTATVWVAMLIALTHPALLGLPVSGVLKSFTVAIGLYVAAGPVVGVLTDLAAARSAPVTAVTVAALALGVAWTGRSVLVEETRLTSAPDRSALDWVAANTPPESTFLVSAFPAFGDTAVAGDDAGWWLPYLTGRRSTLPPITYTLERPLEAGYREKTNELVRLWHEDLDAPATQAALDSAGVTHAFVGEVARANDDAGRGQELAAKLAASPEWRLIHEEGRAQVWERER